MALLFPEGGSDHFAGTAFWPMLLVCLGALALVDPARRTVIWASGIYVAVLVAAYAIPNSLGQNALRPGVVLGPALLVLFARPRAPRAAVVVLAAALLYLQWLPAVRAVEEAHGDPSTAAAFHDEVLRFLAPRAEPGERLEVPLTRNHWEATYLAEDYPLARGWHRQLDRKVNPVFYDADRPLTADRYRRWLQENAVRWVALPTAPLDFSARGERELLLGGLPYLTLVHDSPNWKIWEVRRSRAAGERGRAPDRRRAPTASTSRRPGRGRSSSASTTRRTGRSSPGTRASPRIPPRAGRVVDVRRAGDGARAGAVHPRGRAAEGAALRGRRDRSG